MDQEYLRRKRAKEHDGDDVVWGPSVCDEDERSRFGSVIDGDALSSAPFLSSLKPSKSRHQLSAL